MCSTYLQSTGPYTSGSSNINFFYKKKIISWKVSEADEKARNEVSCLITGVLCYIYMEGADGWILQTGQIMNRLQDRNHTVVLARFVPELIRPTGRQSVLIQE